MTNVVKHKKSQISQYMLTIGINYLASNSKGLIIGMENYIVINGKKAELTDEQLIQLGIKKEVKKYNPFDRVDKGELYYFVTQDSRVDVQTDLGIEADLSQFSSTNYFNSKDITMQIAWHQELYRKLLKYSYDYDAIDKTWDNLNLHYYIVLDESQSCFNIASAYSTHVQGTVYFSNENVASDAIDLVVKPFILAHPDFKW